MKKDIAFPKVEHVFFAIIPESENWVVYIINNNDVPIENVIVASRGYGKINDENRKTSTLRHYFEKIEAKSYKQVELIKEEVFKMNNEYFLTFYIDGNIYDKRFVFLPEVIKEENKVSVPLMEEKGILHK